MRVAAFNDLEQKAAKFKVMRHQCHVSEMMGGLETVFPDLRGNQYSVIAKTLCRFLLQDYTWISTVQMDNRSLFIWYCKCRLRIPPDDDIGDSD